MRMSSKQTEAQRISCLPLWRGRPLILQEHELVHITMDTTLQTSKYIRIGMNITILDSQTLIYILKCHH